MANAICEERVAQTAAKIQEELNEGEEEESSVLSCGDDSLPPVISIAAEGGEVCEYSWEEGHFWFQGSGEEN